VAARVHLKSAWIKWRTAGSRTGSDSGRRGGIYYTTGAAATGAGAGFAFAASAGASGSEVPSGLSSN
jgi:hypothetical protein